VDTIETSENFKDIGKKYDSKKVVLSSPLKVHNSYFIIFLRSPILKLKFTVRNPFSWMIK
jgi:hypothetical protein